MNNKYLGITLTAILNCIIAGAQHHNEVPRLVVNVIVEQMNTNHLEAYCGAFSENGLRKLIHNGKTYRNAHYSFMPSDKTAALASIVTGSTPYYNGIVGAQWLDRTTLIPTSCVDDSRYYDFGTNTKSSPSQIASSTIGDELKVASKGEAIVYGIAHDRDAAIISAGHSADGAFWIDNNSKQWCTSSYYSKKAPKWLNAYNNILKRQYNYDNCHITDMALQCIDSNIMGYDDVTDMIFVTYNILKENKNDIKESYLKLDRNIEKLISHIENKFGKDNILIVLTSSGFEDKSDEEYEKYRIPSGTFYINRSANLLNMYLSAIYGHDKYIDACFYNNIYLNTRMIDERRLNCNDILEHCKSFLMQNSGVQNVYTSNNITSSLSSDKIRNGFNAFHSGDIIIETMPGWKLFNEDNQQQYKSPFRFTPYPIIFYGAGIISDKNDGHVIMERIAPTIAKSIQIRAPNACDTAPLF